MCSSLCSLNCFQKKKKMKEFFFLKHFLFVAYKFFYIFLIFFLFNSRSLNFYKNQFIKQKFIKIQNFTPKLLKSIHFETTNFKDSYNPLDQNQIFTSRLVSSNYFSQIKNSIFFFCNSLSTKYDESEGGALFCAGVILSITNCIFVQNSIVHNAGAIKISSSPKTEIINTLFSENKAEDFSGAVFCYLIYDLSLQYTNFTYNSCEKEVSAISLSLCDISSLSFCSFSNNNSSSKSALYTEVSEVIIKYCSFLFNSISYENNFNDSISLYCSEFSSIKMTNSYFMSNTFKSCFIHENSTSLFENTIFSGSLEEEIINKTNNVIYNSCEFNTDSDYSTPIKVDIQSIQKRIQQNNEYNKEVKNKKNNAQKEKIKITVPDDLLREVENKIENLNNSKSKIIISGTKFIVIFFVIYFCILILIYITIKYIVNSNERKEQEKKDEEEKLKLQELENQQQQQKQQNHPKRKKHKRKIVN